MRKRQSESNYRLQDGLFAGQAPVQVDSRHNLSATQLGSTPGPGLLTHSGLTSSWATKHLGNALLVAPILPIFIFILSHLCLLHLQVSRSCVPTKCFYNTNRHGTGAAPGGDLVL